MNVEDISPDENDIASKSEMYKAAKLVPSADNTKMKIIWKNFYAVILINVMGLYGIYLLITKAMWTTCLYCFVLYILSCLGVTAGAHRLWSHKSYKARLPLRILLMIFHTMSFQFTIFVWARDHRMHHKYSETDADPHNSTRGLFFSHLGWLMVRKHPKLKEKMNTIDISDLQADPVVQFQRKYQPLLMLLICGFLPTYVPTLWRESPWIAFYGCVAFRIALLMHIAGLINSFAHYSDSYKWGTKPYDQHINPVDVKPISLVILGEGSHNFHHVFPWDYKSEELGGSAINITKHFIDAMAKLGWAYDLKTVSRDVVANRVKRSGDGSHYAWGRRNNDIQKGEEKNFY